MQARSGPFGFFFFLFFFFGGGGVEVGSKKQFMFNKLYQ